MAFFSQNDTNVSLLFVLLSQSITTIMTKLSVNINKIATLRNARGGDVPNVVKVALDCESFGADGITVHPRFAGVMCTDFVRCSVRNLT